MSSSEPKRSRYVDGCALASRSSQRCLVEKGSDGFDMTDWAQKLFMTENKLNSMSPHRLEINASLFYHLHPGRIFIIFLGFVSLLWLGRGGVITAPAICHYPHTKSSTRSSADDDSVGKAPYTKFDEIHVMHREETNARRALYFLACTYSLLVRLVVSSDR